MLRTFTAFMRHLFISIAEVLGLIIVLRTIHYLNFPLFVLVSLGIILISIFVLITGLSASRIQSRGKAFVIASVTGIILMAGTTVYEEEREKRLAVLRVNNFDAYFSELSDFDEKRWLSELRKIRPHAYAKEMKRRRKEAEAVRISECTRGKLAEAYVMIQADMRRQLKAPTTAEFPWRYSAGTKYEGNCIYQVVGYVNAQNSFGAMLRTGFEGRIEYFPESGSWRTVKLKIDR